MNSAKRRCFNEHPSHTLVKNQHFCIINQKLKTRKKLEKRTEKWRNETKLDRKDQCVSSAHKTISIKTTHTHISIVFIYSLELYASWSTLKLKPKMEEKFLASKKLSLGESKLKPAKEIMIFIPQLLETCKDTESPFNYENTCVPYLLCRLGSTGI